MRKFAVIVAGGLIVLSTSVITSGATSASPRVQDPLTIQGSSFGLKSIGSGNLFVAQFTETNTGSHPVDISFLYSWSNASAPDYKDYICPQVKTGGDVSPDTPACEPGFLAPGQSTQAALIVIPDVSGVPVKVKACALDLTDDLGFKVQDRHCATVRAQVS